ncbi:Uncharacterized protein TPAR_00340 [Tolypocladium paradoxum]|uniref:F-box domain-containing protein n=1 Tax=Tolypocladium paradoxum TaxID=94208 RepID=A0A2S4LAK3_9HYPO|nr:Uncharacterized protein TPAR_00340 [Tolypocladium paradoxum]
MAAAAAGDELAAAKPPTRTGLKFLDLPAETQQEIVSHCSQTDLICLALASKRLHELASAQLYRNFHIVFPDDDDINFDSPTDGLAGGLDTFTTSEYNYAKHLRDLSMDTLSAGVKGEHSYQSYLYSASCGKFLNTLLYLTLKKAKSLEAFRSVPVCFNCRAPPPYADRLLGRWNIRVELSRPVYRELHRIASLTKLHVRMQAGDSYYNPPPPLPVSVDAHVQQNPTGHWYAMPPPPPPGSLPPPPLPPAFSSPPPPSGPPPALEPPSKSAAKSKAGKRSLGSKEPSTISGFKNLKSLCILDIDNVGIVQEIRTCVKNSYSTLKALQLSLSDALAQQARKPPPDSDADDSDVDDDFQVVPASQNTSYDASGPAKAFRAQEERKIQEGILGRIFDIEQTLIKKSPIQRNCQERASGSAKGKEVEKLPSTRDAREDFIASIKDASTKLMALQNGSRAFSISQQDILDTIERAARKYVDSSDSDSPLRGKEGPSASSDSLTSSAKDKEAGNLREGLSEGEETGKGGPSSGGTGTEDKTGQSTTGGDAAAAGVPEGPKYPDRDSLLKALKSILGGEELSPEDIDIAHVDMVGDDLEDEPDEQAVPGAAVEEKTCEGQAAVSDPAASHLTKLACTTVDALLLAETAARVSRQVQVEKAKLEPLTGRLGYLQEQVNKVAETVETIRASGEAMTPSKIQSVEAELQLLYKSVGDMFNDMQVMEAEVDTLTTGVPARMLEMVPKGENLRRYMDAYTRDTRGLSLESLSIHLVPVKASVLSRGVDLANLKQLTLLNVGNQAPIWSQLIKEGKVRPLALRSVFTDHVTNVFLSCMAQLPELHDLFLLERSVKHKPESFAPRSTTTIDQIRRLVLKKHMPTLRRLMIKDESNGPNWDANEKTMILTCTRGARLEELALSMNIHAVHAFMQYFSGLTSLRAINILHFKNNDTCIWVMREILRFIVDNLSHHPELKLEWIAMEDDRVDRVVRPSESSDEVPENEPAKRSKGKGKGKSHAPVGATSDGAFPLLPVDGLDSESDSDDEGFDSGTRLRFKTVGPVQFYDVWGVKIFEKEIRSGRL